VFLSALAGLGLGLSLIVAIGAQNLFVLRQGLRREYVLLVAAICAGSDALLIVLGVSGVGLVVQSHSWVLSVVRWCGAAFLICYGLLAARRAWRPLGGLSVDAAPAEAGMPGGAPTGQLAVAVRSRLAPTVLTCLALTWLNPHVYLDTVFLLGTVASSHGDGRWAFAAGAMLASLLWFFGLALGSRFLASSLRTPRAWRVLDSVIALVMITLGAGLVLAH
jgi:L-lysine exporter family protein LysE/ArgO